MGKRSALPAIIRHPSNRAYIRPTCPHTRKRLTIYLGVWPPDQAEPPPAVLIERLKAMQLITAGKDPKAEAAGIPRERTVLEFYNDWCKWAETYYEQRIQDDYDRCFAPVLIHLGPKPVEGLTIGDLKAIQDILVSTGRTRQGINRQIARIKAVFSSGASVGLCSGVLSQNLAVLRQLERKRTKAPESKELAPLTRQEFDQIKTHLSPVLQDMATVQWLTACRPGEICRMSWSEISQDEGVWFYRPSEHKTAHHGHVREIPIGPEAQAILAKYRKITGQIFNPKDAHRAFVAAGGRWSPMIKPGDAYDTKAYTRAIARAGTRAGVTASANRIRKGRSQEITEALGELESARFLGHRVARMAERHYNAKTQTKLVREISEKLEKSHLSKSDNSKPETDKS